MHKFLYIILTVATLTATSCTPKLFSGMEKDGKQDITANQLYPSVAERNQTIQYTMEINARGNVLNGVLSVMEDDNNEFRTVFTSVFGVTMFDVILTPDSFKVLSCPPQMQSRNIIGVLQNDLRCLFFKELTEGKFKAKVYTKYYQSNSAIVSDNEKIKLNCGYSFKNHYGKYLFMTDEVEQNTATVIRKGSVTKTQVNFEYKSGTRIAEKIALKHSKLGLSINLTRMEN